MGKSDAAAAQIFIMFGCLFLAFCVYLIVYAAFDCVSGGNTTVFPITEETAESEPPASTPECPARQDIKKPPQNKQGGDSDNGDCVFIPNEVPNVPPPPLPEGSATPNARFIPNEVPNVAPPPPPPKG